ncbi:hypothetical protein GGR56DRAFT_102533 [Xylariaceae sp. FL0804]|nr:hypothetical protein GGR56DRAFT_102533 [Xylariaceae sp. FL0804]
MLAARDQENLAFTRQNGAALKQQQKTPGARYPKTPLKVPLNDENGARAMGAKSILGGGTRGNENAMTSKGVKGLDKSRFVTPMGPRTRPVLGDKTTNAKTKGVQTGNVKSHVRETGQSQTKAIKPRQKQPQAETQKLKVHAGTDEQLSEEEPEYCPPNPTNLPYESDVFPDGVLKFDALKPENRLKGYYGYYFNPVDEYGVSQADRDLEERTKKALDEGDRRIKEDLDNFEWSIEEELGLGSRNTKTTQAPKKSAAKPLPAKPPSLRRPVPSIKSRTAAGALSLDDQTKSLQRRAAQSSESRKPLQKKTTGFAVPGLRPNRQLHIPSTEKKGIEANSRTTIGYNKGRSTASVLARGGANPNRVAPKSAIPRSETTLSNDSDKTITPSRYAQKKVSAAAEDQEWRQRVPFLSIFNPEDDEDDDCGQLTGGPPPNLYEEEDEEEVELKLID